MNNIFARKQKNGNYLICNENDGSVVTRIDKSIYPVNSDVSARYEHPAGIELTKCQVMDAGIDIE
ncbi:unnamed protein product [marine sediment metagenome]|uniref:Uncharacterized protein n=1 Tax=marine sediment metagenome TaxID=412755 RepID=X0TJQ6_9ZZZZ